MPPRDRTVRCVARLVLCGLFSTLSTAALATTPSETAPPVLLSDVVQSQAGQLAALDSNAGAVALFTSAIGPSLGLRDVAGTLGAKGLPAKLAKELGVAELALSAQQLVAALAAWQFAEMVSQAIGNRPSADPAPVLLPSPSRQEWFKANGPFPWLPDLLQRLNMDSQPDASEPIRQAQRAELALAANRLAFEANQRAVTTWWELQGWKERVRQARGRARLCGTWQWVIHNHQNHREQKTVMVFPPAGQEKPSAPLPAEIVVLGDNVYLRWEMEGRVQEDSLLFIKEGTRIEGSFVNNLGGWGAITGKRTSSCQP